jgi:hypothetical protein
MPDTRTLYTYDVQTDTWAQPAVTSKPNMSGRGVIATPLAAYGVTFFTACGSTCNIYVYKAGAGSAAEKSPSTQVRAGLSVSPNPVRGRAVVEWTGHALREGTQDATLYDLRGRKVFSLSACPDGFTMDVHAMPAGIYTLKVGDKNGALTKRVLIER